MDEGEPVELAALREAKEETTLDVTLTDLLYVYSRPDRDPRQHTMSTVFIGVKAGGILQAADDAINVRAFALDELPEDMCFDHAEILSDYKHFKKTNKRPSPQDKLSRVSS